MAKTIKATRIKTISDNLLEFINSVDFSVENVANDYYNGNNEYYQTDLKQFNVAKKEALNIMAQLGDIGEDELLEACKSSYGGRLDYVGGQFKYTAGQFYDLEVPMAVCAVLDKIQRNRCVHVTNFLTKKCDKCGKVTIKHELRIISLHDAKADCKCGWHYVFTGEKTKQEIREEFEKHL